MTQYNTDIKTARSLLNYSNQIANMLYARAAEAGIDPRSDFFAEMMDIYWAPAYKKATDFTNKIGVKVSHVA